MTKITQQQVNDINSKCKNGFTFCIQGYVEAGRKRLNKIIMLKEDEKMVEAELCWAEENVHQKNSHTDATRHIARETSSRCFVSLSGVAPSNRAHGSAKDSETSMSLKISPPQRK